MTERRKEGKVKRSAEKKKRKRRMKEKWTKATREKRKNKTEEIKRMTNASMKLGEERNDERNGERKKYEIARKRERI